MQAAKSVDIGSEDAGVCAFPEEVEPQLRSKRMASAIAMFVGTGLLSTIIAAGLWDASDRVPILLWWGFAMFVCSGCTLHVWQRTEPSRHVLIAALSGLAWSAAPFVFVGPNDWSDWWFVSLAIAGLSAVRLAVHGASFRANAWFLSLVLLPLVLRALLFPTAFALSMAVAMLVFYGVLMLLARRVSHLIGDNAEARATIACLHAEKLAADAVQAAVGDREALQRVLLDSLPFWVWLKDADGRLLELNQQMARDLGAASVAELRGAKLVEVYQRTEEIEHGRHGGSALQTIAWHVSEECSQSEALLRWREFHRAPILSAEDHRVGTIGHTRDVTSLHLAQERAQRLERVLDDLAVAVLFVDRDGRFGYVGDGAVRMLGYERTVMRGRLRMWDIDETLGEAEYSSWWAREPGEKLPIESKFLARDGRRVEVLRFDGEHIADGEGQWRVVVAHDVGLPNALRRERDLAHFSLARAKDAHLLADADGRLLVANDSACEMFGYERTDLLRMRLHEILPMAAKWDSQWAVQQASSTASFESKIRRRSGRVVDAAVFVSPISYSDGHYLAVWACDVGDRIAAASQIRAAERIATNHAAAYEAQVAMLAQERQYRAVLGAMPEAFAMLEVSAGEQVRIVDVNPSFERMFSGQIDLAGPRNRLAPAVAEQIEEPAGFVVQQVLACVRDKRSIHAFARIKCALGIRDVQTAWIPVSLATDRQRVACLMRDVTDAMHVERTIRSSEREFRVLAENSPDMIVCYDARLRRVFTNRSMMVSAEYAVGAVGAMVIDEPPPGMVDSKEYCSALSRALKTGLIQDFETEFQPTSRGATMLSAHIQIVPLRDESGEVSGVMAVGRDITERKRAERALAESEFKYRTLVESIPGIIARYDRGGRLVYANSQFTQMTSNAPIDMFAAAPVEHGQLQYEDAVRQVIATGQRRKIEQMLSDENGERRIFLIDITPERDAIGAIAGVLAVGRDISEIQKYRQKIHSMAYFDQLTALPNRMLFTERMRAALGEASKTRQLVGLMMIDLDRFNSVNETLGHAAGDALLRGAASRLVECMRSADTVARMGGDEFALVLPNVSARGDLDIAAAKILAAFAPPFSIDNQELFVSVSIGIAVYPADGATTEELIKFADTALYQAKAAGRNTFQFYSVEMTAQARERTVLEADLRRAIVRNEFEVFYQPKVSLIDGTVVGAEALLRWNHPQRGRVAPDQFIPIAEDSGLIVDIGAHVLQSACRFAALWNESTDVMNGRQVNRRIAVNLSARQFQDNNIVEVVRAALRNTHCKPEWIELEITEGLLLEERSDVHIALEAIDELGVSIAIDDFGTGFSALSYLSRFPIRTLKIDRSFVVDVTGDADDAPLVQAILAMARNLHMTVVAEGIERAAQAEMLRGWGCQLAQGAWFGEPMDEVEFMRRYLTSRESMPGLKN